MIRGRESFSGGGKEPEFIGYGAVSRGQRLRGGRAVFRFSSRVGGGEARVAHGTPPPATALPARHGNGHWVGVARGHAFHGRPDHAHRERRHRQRHQHLLWPIIPALLPTEWVE